MAKKITISFLQVLLLFIFIIHPQVTQGDEDSTQQTLWKYQCIDTMKISRDKARLWTSESDLINHISWEMKIIRGMGANCVAIDTPYDEEFYLYLSDWVKGARNAKLHVWFRGNFAGWEEWFNYPKLTSTNTFLQNIHAFIIKHKDLFQDGDIFTPAPEAEDGGPFNQVAPNAYVAYRNFLVSEYSIATQSFTQINKQVQVNFLSMNGGFAKRMLDQNTVSHLGNVVTIDHYIKTAPEMGQYIQYFANTFHAKVVVGEFGAPIPDINGNMTEEEQATFTDQVFQQLYINRSNILGINYWDLYDGSTALINPDQTPRAVVQVIKKYFFPLRITGSITDDLGNTLVNIPIKTAAEIGKTYSDSQGNYNLLLPDASTQITIGDQNYYNQTVNITISSTDMPTIVNQKIILKPIHPSFYYRFQLFIKNFRKQLKI